MIKSRLAPTPSGFLHIGNLYAFVLTWLAVRQQQGKLLLRIDDIDNERSRPEYLENIFAWLDLLGLTYNEGPKSVAEFSQQWSQQTRLPLYEKLLQQLVATGKVYACNCSRKLITKNNGNGLYQGTCRHKNISLSQPGVNWRIQVDEDAVITFEDEMLGMQKLQPAALMGDFVIRRRNGLPSYQIASLADDIHFGINFIVRGEDLLASTAAQLYLAKLVHATDFLTAHFTHHPLLKNDAGEKLSKTAGSALVTHTSLQSKDVQSVWQQIVQQLGKAMPAKGISQVSDLLFL
jgi:glutamyl-tRNA synthetase